MGGCEWLALVITAVGVIFGLPPFVNWIKDMLPPKVVATESYPHEATGPQRWLGGRCGTVANVLPGHERHYDSSPRTASPL